MQPVLAVYAGYSARQRVTPGPDLEPYVQDALDEIEYVTAIRHDLGARRAKNATPRRSNWNMSRSARRRLRPVRQLQGPLRQFYDAIKAKYPALQVIATSKVTSRVPDVMMIISTALRCRCSRIRIITTKPIGPAEDFRGRMGHTRRLAHTQHERRTGGRRVDDGHGTQLGRGHHVLLRAPFVNVSHVTARTHPCNGGPI